MENDNRLKLETTNVFFLLQHDGDDPLAGLFLKGKVFRSTKLKSLYHKATNLQMVFHD